MTRNDLYAPSNEILNNFTFLERNNLSWLSFDISFHSLASFALFENSGKIKHLIYGMFQNGVSSIVSKS